MTPQSTRAARGTLLLLLSQILLSASGYVVAVILARGLGPSGYGVYGIVYSVLLGVELIARLGVPQALTKLIAERSERSTTLEATGITLMLIVYLTIFAAFWLGSPQLADLFRVEGGARLFRIASLDIPFYGMFFACGHVLMGRRMFAVEAAAGFLYAVSKMVGMVGLLYIGISVAGALVVNVLASVVALAFTVRWVGLRAFRPTLIFWSDLTRLALPIGLFALGSQLLLSLDLWSLNALGAGVSDEIKGWYVVATNAARIPNVVGFVLMGVLIPSLSHARAAGEPEKVSQTLQNSARFLAVMLLPGCALIAVEARDLLQLIFSEAYVSAAPYLRVLIFGHGLLYTFLLTASGILIACGLAGTAARIMLALLPVGVLLNAVLIHMSGAMGAGLAALFVDAAGAVVAGVIVSRRVGSLLSARVLVRAMIATSLVALAGGLVHLRGPLLIVEVIVLLAGYVGLAFMLDLLSMADVRMFLPVGPRRAGEGDST